MTNDTDKGALNCQLELLSTDWSVKGGSKRVIWPLVSGLKVEDIFPTCWRVKTDDSISTLRVNNSKLRIVVYCFRSVCNFSCKYSISFKIIQLKVKKKSRIREKPNLSTDANRSTNTEKVLKSQK